MARARRISKKKLKEPDEFISFIQKGIRFVLAHQKEIVAGGIAIVIVASGLFVYRMYENKREVEAEARLGFEIERYTRIMSPSQNMPMVESKDLIGRLEGIASNYSRTAAGKLALLYAGNVHLKLGEFDQAIKKYQIFLDKAGKESLHRLFALEGLGYAYEGKKEYERAIDAYMRIVGLGENFCERDAYLNMARCYERLGKNKEALENYRRALDIEKDAPGSEAIARKVSLLEK